MTSRCVLGVAIAVGSCGCFVDPPPTSDGTGSGGPTSTGPIDASGESTSPAGSETSSSGDPATSATTESSASGSDSESTGASSSDTTGSADACGDGIVDDNEMCDGGNGCRRDCTFTDYACNPLNNAGCSDGDRCGLVTFESETFACMSPGAGVVGAACGDAIANDGDCGNDLTCLFHGQTDLCDMDACCVRYCTLADGGSDCGLDEVCEVFFPAPIHLGLELLGFCGDG